MTRSTSSCTPGSIGTAGLFIANEHRPMRGDYVDLMAQMDVLAVPNVCGADVMMTSDFELKPLKLSVFEATNETGARWSSPRGENQRTRPISRCRRSRPIASSRAIPAIDPTSPMSR